MEEATELFAIQRQQVRLLMARTNALVAGASTPSTVARMPKPVTAPRTPAVVSALETLDPWGEGLLFVAFGAGLLAALMKRAQGPAPASPGRPSSPGSSSRKS